MKFLCLAYYEPEKFAALTPEQTKALVSQCPPRDAALNATGQVLVTASLGGAGKVTALRPRGGQTSVTDGPFTESKELVGAFLIIEAADHAEAVRIASLHPAAGIGEQAGWGIELHPIEMFRDHAAAGGKA